MTSLVIVTFGAWLTVSRFASALGLVTLPPLYWPLLLTMLISYVVLTQMVKAWFVRRYGD